MHREIQLTNPFDLRSCNSFGPMRTVSDKSGHRRPAAALPFHTADGVTEGVAQGTQVLPVIDRSLALYFFLSERDQRALQDRAGLLRFLFHHNIQHGGQHLCWSVCPDLFIVGHRVDMGLCCKQSHVS